MKLKNIFFITLITLALSACSPNDNQNKTDNGGQNGTPGTPIEVDDFEECVAAGNQVMESYPRQCRDGDQTFVEDISITPPESNEPLDDQACSTDFEPVCGEVDVDSYKITFYNICEAERVSAQNITEGTCSAEGSIPKNACSSFPTYLHAKWLSETQECEGMAKEMCDNLGGTYNDCASACRNNPEAEMCTMLCVEVCQF